MPAQANLSGLRELGSNCLERIAHSMEAELKRVPGTRETMRRDNPSSGWMRSVSTFGACGESPRYLSNSACALNSWASVFFSRAIR
mgnify:CR=1 FL=1